MKEVRRVLYRLPELVAADPEAWVFIAEGEKDVNRLARAGLTATCNVGGAGKWLLEYNEDLRNRRVCIMPANRCSALSHQLALVVSHSRSSWMCCKVASSASLPRYWKLRTRCLSRRS